MTHIALEAPTLGNICHQKTLCIIHIVYHQTKRRRNLSKTLVYITAGFDVVDWFNLAYLGISCENDCKESYYRFVVTYTISSQTAKTKM